MPEMTQLHYTLRFTTPAFLGNAEQNAQWRTPPIKALLRQWWRVAYAADKDFEVDVRQMRREEGLLFGHAWLEDDRHEGKNIAARKSLVRLRLNSWGIGQLQKENWAQLASVPHPEVPKPVAADLYLGFGPVILEKGKGRSSLKKNAAIQAGEKAQLALAVPRDHAETLQRALALMDSYGTLGGRSRNGWGSFDLRANEGTAALPKVQPLRDWQKALELDWPHAIGQDNDQRALIWQTAAAEDWPELMVALAKIKIGLRTQFRFVAGNSHSPQDRHWLSYPVTKHSVQSWGSYRLPNSLRFKVHRAGSGGSRLFATIFHVPCSPPVVATPNQKQQIVRVWQSVYRFLDGHQSLQRASGAAQ